jgi:YihY family inner membrane protein
MTKNNNCAALIARHPVRFFLTVVRGFRANQGILLSGAVAFYTLLSMIPIFTLLLVVLSHFMDEQQLLNSLAENLELVAPGFSKALMAQIQQFLQHRHVVGWVVLLFMLFFSSMAFTVLENAMSFIFFHRVSIRRRHFLISAVIPYIYILLLGFGLFLITLIGGALRTVEDQQIVLLTWVWRLDGLTATVLYLLGVIGLILMLTSFYIVLPGGRVSLRHAMVGGITAGILWEIVRHGLIWYFSTLSVVNVIYGSLATAIVALVSLEVAAMILLFGAQVIAEYERLGRGDDCPDGLEEIRTGD